MKITLLICLLFTSINSYADFSSVVIGHNTPVKKVHRAQNEIILTFDDGPTPGVTNRILNTLKKHNIKGTFFVQAENAINYPELMNRIVNEGHIVGNHSYTHQVLTNLEYSSWKQVVQKEVLDAHEVIAPYMTNAQHFYYRAPGGYWEPRFAQFLNEDEIGKNYIGPIHWDIGGKLEIRNGRVAKAADWECWRKKVPVNECLSGYIAETRQNAGGVVLIHDVSPQSAEMLERYLAILGNAFTFRTLDDLNLNDKK